MRSRDWIAASCLCMSAAAMAQSAPPAAPPAYLQGMVSEEDVAAVFDYLRSALTAAAEGREAPLPDDLRSRMELLGAELKLRGTIGGLLLLKSIEAEIKQLLRERPPASPGAAPYTTPNQRLSAIR